MTDYQQGMIEKLAQLDDIFGFKKNKETPTGEVVGGIAGGAGGAAVGRKMMRKSPNAYSNIINAIGSKKNVTGKLMKTYGKYMIPLALVGTAIGAVTGGRIQEEL